jgi:hypothetical protein
MIRFYRNTKVTLLTTCNEEVCSDQAKSSECCVVAQIYRQLSPYKVYVSSPTSCCNEGIQGVSCNGEKVTRIFWNGKDLSGNIPESIGDLTNLYAL